MGKKVKKMSIKIEGGIQNAKELKEILTRSLEENDKIMLDVSETQSIDLTTIQLCLAAQKTAQTLDKTISFLDDHSVNFDEIIKAAGFELFSDSTITGGKNEKWIRGVVK